MTTVTSANRTRPISVTTSKALGGTGTVVTPIFGITGDVEILALYGVVTTVLGANQTAAFWRLNDQTAQVAITLATGTAISAAPVGSVIARTALAATALTYKSAAAGGVIEPNAATAADVFVPIALVQKTAGVTTNVEFVYTTTDNPTSGVIKYTLRYLPLSDGASVTAL